MNSLCYRDHFYFSYSTILIFIVCSMQPVISLDSSDYTDNDVVTISTGAAGHSSPTLSADRTTQKRHHSPWLLSRSNDNDEDPVLAGDSDIDDDVTSLDDENNFDQHRRKADGKDYDKEFSISDGDDEDLRCRVNEALIVPESESSSLDGAAKYPFAEAGLQIFTELRIPCDGLLYEWQFIAINPIVLGLHLGVFRIQSIPASAYRSLLASPGGSNYPTASSFPSEHEEGINKEGSHEDGVTLRLVGESYISYYEFDDGLTSIWSFFNLSSPIPVREGDLIGLFYDDFQTSQSKITIGSRQIGGRELASMPHMAWSPTFVFLMGADELANAGNIINTKNATTLPYRKPALRAVITGDPSDWRIKTTTTKKTTTTTTTATISRPPTTPLSLLRNVPPFRRRRRTTTTTTTMAPPPLSVAPPVAMPHFLPNNNNNDKAVTTTASDIISFANRQDVPSLPSSDAQRCYRPPEIPRYCIQLQNRAYFDIDQGVCWSFFGCAAASTMSVMINNFVNLADCISTCHEAIAAKRGLPSVGLTTDSRGDQVLVVLSKTSSSGAAAAAGGGGRIKGTSATSANLPAQCYELPPLQESVFTGDCNRLHQRFHFDSHKKTCYSTIACSRSFTSSSDQQPQQSLSSSAFTLEQALLATEEIEPSFQFHSYNQRFPAAATDGSLSALPSPSGTMRRRLQSENSFDSLISCMQMCAPTETDHQQQQLPLIAHNRQRQQSNAPPPLPSATAHQSLPKTLPPPTTMSFTLEPPWIRNRMSDECHEMSSISPYCAQPSVRYFYHDRYKYCFSLVGCPPGDSVFPSNNFNSHDECMNQCQPTDTHPSSQSHLSYSPAEVVGSDQWSAGQTDYLMKQHRFLKQEQEPYSVGQIDFAQDSNANGGILTSGIPANTELLPLADLRKLILASRKYQQQERLEGHGLEGDGDGGTDRLDHQSSYSTYIDGLVRKSRNDRSISNSPDDWLRMRRRRRLTEPP